MGENIVTLFPDFLEPTHIGSGAFSKVYRTLHKRTGMPVAVKVVPKSLLADPTVAKNMERELSILEQVDHPFISHYYGHKADDTGTYIASEFATEGSLLTLVNKSGPRSEDQAHKIFCQLLAALRYLHEECRIAHRDLKMENVLLTRGQSVRLIDFGLSMKLAEGVTLMETRCGSFPYAAPEMFRMKKYTQAIDMWSAGVILFVLVHGRLPFHDESHVNLAHKICHNEPEYSPNLSPELLDLLKGLLMKDCQRRLTARQASEHPWIAHGNQSNVEYASDARLGQRKFHVLPKTPEEIDRDMLQRMTQWGISIDGFDEDIFAGRDTDATITYKIMRMDQVNASLFAQARGAAKAKGQRSSGSFVSIEPTARKKPATLLMSNEATSLELMLKRRRERTASTKVSNLPPLLGLTKP